MTETRRRPWMFQCFGFLIYRELPGVISAGRIWICFHTDYMYSHDTLCKLLWQMATKWKDDRFLVG